MKWYPALITAAWVATYILIVVGGIVRLTGSGLGCPDWPLCYNQFIPPPRPDAWVEFSHRFSAAITSVLIVASLVFAFFPKRLPSAPWILGATVALVLQIGLGGIVVILELPALAVNIHLMVAMVVFGLTIAGSATVWPAHWRVPSGSAGEAVTKLRGPAWIAVIATFFLMISGSYVFGSGASLACNGWPLCEGNALPQGVAENINYQHRIVAAAVGIIVMMVGARARRLRAQSPAVGVAGIATIALFSIQILVGAGVVLGRLGGPWPVLHLAFAAAVWAALVVLLALVSMPAGASAAPAGTANAASSASSRPAAARGDQITMTVLERLEVTQTETAEAPEEIPTGIRAIMRSYLALTKPIIVVLLLITTGTTMFVAAGGFPDPWLLLATLIGGALSAAGANTINSFYDRDIDPLMKRTQRRPLVTGHVSPRAALVFGIGLGAGSFIWLTLTVNLLAATLALTGLLFYVLVYTMFLKRSTTHNIVIGGVAGSIPPVVGWAAVTGQIDLPAIYLFSIIFFWTPPHFWALALLTKHDYASASVPMLPVVRGDEETRRQILLYSVVLFAVSLLLYGGRAMGIIYLLSAIALGAGWLWYALKLYWDGSRKRAAKLFGYSNGYLALIFVAMVLDRMVQV